MRAVRAIFSASIVAMLTSLVGCRGPGHLPVAREFGALRDTYGAEASLEAILRERSAGPWRLIVGGADQLDELVATAIAGGADIDATIVDMSVGAAQERAAHEARALEVALDLGGALLLDDDGAEARTLRGVAREVTLVVLSAQFAILSAEATQEVSR